ncbi:response regulator [Cytobacillus sp. NCCP-133]|uniref:response regulator n=1 Tax=Cytobacillus sp. NCCP-133 TaxID=766848 RepID=UPI002230F3D8|nr:response regulator [Cytobacillus sp. NCCP-133]GLB61062.1 transcriptional regulatory protein MalR [Cytobacillus sp. NCCP-133]
MIKVLIVEDDPMVAEFNKRYLSEVEGFIHTGTVHNVADGLEFLEDKTVDLILLDVYMPGRNGLELLKKLREQGMGIDVIVITAASDTEKIQTALRLGAADYLIKPFEFERFQHALLSYKDKYQFLNKKQSINQVQLDKNIIINDQRTSGESEQFLPKGLTKTTLQGVIRTINGWGNGPFTTDELAEKTDISRVSIRKYLRFLTEIGVLEETLTYGIGRPVSQYSYKETNSYLLDAYISK